MNMPGKVVASTLVGMLLGAGITHFGVWVPRANRIDDAFLSMIDPRRIHASDKEAWDAMWPRLMNEIVALVELHRARSGAYPESLVDLEYPPMATLPHLELMSYRRSEDGSAYHITPPEGLNLPAGFWKGTGRTDS